jgi:hypothetical protein
VTDDAEPDVIEKAVGRTVIHGRTMATGRCKSKRGKADAGRSVAAGRT